MSKEIWKSIPDYKQYEASNLGRIRSIDRLVDHEESFTQSAYSRSMKGIILKPYISTIGNYEVVTIYHEGKRKKRSVHILVCLAFNGKRPANKKNALHKDGNSRNNKSNNLYWGTLTENWDDMRKHGRDRYGEKHPLTNLTLKQAQDIYDSRFKGVRAKYLSIKYGITAASICDIYKGRTWPQVTRK